MLEMFCPEAKNIYDNVLYNFLRIYSMCYSNMKKGPLWRGCIISNNILVYTYSMFIIYI